MAISDEQAVANLVFTYAERIDAGDFAGVAALFEHAVITSEGASMRTEGTAAVQALYEGTTRRYEDGTPKSHHVTTNLLIEVDSEAHAATCRSKYTVFQATPTLALQPIIAGRYHDRFVVGDDGAWRFAARHMHVDLIGDLGQHLLFELRG